MTRIVSANIIFYFKKTNELNSEEINQLNNLFNSTFRESLKNERSIEEFKRKYLTNILEFSFHGIMKFNNKIVGCYNVIPQEFRYFKKRCIFGLSVDTSIEKKYRGNIYNLKKLANIVYSELKNFNIPFVYGLPNDKFYLVKKKLLGWKDIGEIDYYVSLGSLNFLNKLIKFFISSFNVDKKKKISESNISKIYSNMFKKWRYDDNHIIIKKNDAIAFLKLEVKKKFFIFKIAVILDIFPITADSLQKISEEIKKKYADVKAIIYFGKLSHIPENFFLLPNFILKRQTIFSGKILDDSLSGQLIFNLINWNINLSNFDDS